MSRTTLRGAHLERLHFSLLNASRVDALRSHARALRLERVSGSRSALAAAVAATLGGRVRLLRGSAPKLPRAARRRFLELLRLVPWRLWERRRGGSNVARRSMSQASFVLGGFYLNGGRCRATTSRRRTTVLRVPGVVRASGDRRAVAACAALWDLMRRVLRRVDPGFRFTSLIVNRGFSAGAAHVDANNTRHQYVLSAGPFRGGRLLTSTAQAGTLAVYDCHDRPTLHEGRRAHVVLPYSGERYSLVAYSVDTAPTPQRSNLPHEHGSRRLSGREAERLVAANRRFQERMEARAEEVLASRSCEPLRYPTEEQRR